MPSRRHVLAALLALSACRRLHPEPEPASPLPTPRPPAPGFQRGVNLAHLHQPGIGYGTAASRRQLERLRDLGVSHVALTPFGYTPAVDSPEIRFGAALDRSLTDADLLAEAAQARALGLEVCLKPHIWSTAFWQHGQSRQDIRPPAWDAWFARYAEFAVHYARLAEQMEAALYVVGLEYLQATRDNPGAWADVATQCRAVYAGPLSYAANWWSEIDAFQDWTAFDFIGVNAYYPLTTRPDPDTATLLAAWREPLAALERLSDRFQRPVLMLETGCRTVQGAAAQPWDQGLQGDPDPDLQARYYEALLAAAADQQRWLAGIYWWKWFTDEDRRERDDYSPMGLPAEAVLRRWWAPVPTP